MVYKYYFRRIIKGLAFFKYVDGGCLLVSDKAKKKLVERIK
jgi:hypothetical protein